MSFPIGFISFSTRIDDLILEKKKGSGTTLEQHVHAISVQYNNHKASVPNFLLSPRCRLLEVANEVRPFKAALRRVGASHSTYMVEFGIG